MARFMLLLHESVDGLGSLSPEDMQAIVAEYSAWANNLAEQGKLLAGEKLVESGGRILVREGDAVKVMDGPFSESKEVMGGFFVIEAEHEQAAVELCRDCPHLKYGLRIELRRVEEMEGQCGA